MFEDLFIDPGTIVRYRSTPLLAERLSYLDHCAHEGARRRSPPGSATPISTAPGSYLSMTPELLNQASVRFDKYVNGGNHE